MQKHGLVRKRQRTRVLRLQFASFWQVLRLARRNRKRKRKRRLSCPRLCFTRPTFSLPKKLCVAGALKCRAAALHFLRQDKWGFVSRSETRAHTEAKIQIFRSLSLWCNFFNVPPKSVAHKFAHDGDAAERVQWALDFMHA